MNKKKLIAGIILIGVGVFFFATTFMPKNTESNERAAAWQRVSKEGTEVEASLSTIETETHSEGTRRNRKVSTVYCGVYTFTVSDTKYTAKAVGDDCKPTHTEAQGIKKVTVVYDTATPSDAFVKSDASKEHFKNASDSKVVAYVIGGFLILFGALGIYSGRPLTPEQIAAKEEKRRKAQEEYERLMAEINKKQEEKKKK